MTERLRFAVHNGIAHPLLVLCPPAGEWLHDATIPRPHRPLSDRERRQLAGVVITIALSLGAAAGAFVEFITRPIGRPRR